MKKITFIQRFNRLVYVYLNTLFVLIIMINSSNAEVILDGSLGQSGEIQIQDQTYEIIAKYGKLSNTNLYHSFEKFDINSGEMAIFSGPPSVENIISRITGGESSYIDGIISSTIFGANLYLLNPSGLMFGPGAFLNITGSFHGSTADYLRMADDQKFFATPLENELLSADSPTTFGFLDDSIAPIKITGRGEITEEEYYKNPTGLVVPFGKNISLVGGDITFEKGIFYQGMETVFDLFGVAQQIPAAIMLELMNAPEGQINLTSVASKGEVPCIYSDGNLPQITKYGNIIVKDKTLLAVTSGNPGDVYIRAENFELFDSGIYSETYGMSIADGGIVDIQAIGGSISLLNGSKISASVFTPGIGASVKLKATDSINIAGENEKMAFSTSGILNISINPYGMAGDCGEITLDAKKNIYLTGGSYIIGNTYNNGKGGDMTINADESVILSGESSKMDMSKILLLSYDTNENAGDGGNLNITANNIILEDGSSLNSAIFGPVKGGDITLEANELVSFSGMNRDPFYADLVVMTFMIERREYNMGGIFTLVLPSSSGDAGKVNIKTGDLIIKDGFQINSVTLGPGNSGDVTVKADGLISLEGALASGIWVSFISSSSFPLFVHGGNSGNVSVEAGELILKDGCFISSESSPVYGLSSGRSGEVKVDVAGDILISGVNPYGTERGYRSSGILAQSLGKGDTADDAGTIEISAKSLTLENGAWIAGSTIGNSNAGNIKIQVVDKIRILGDSIGESFIENAGIGVNETRISGIYSSSYGVDAYGLSGSLDIKAKSLEISNNGTISTLSLGQGDAGNIDIDLNNLTMDNTSTISSASKNPVQGGAAGSINLNANNSIKLLNNSSLSTEAVNMASTSNQAHDLSGKIILSVKDQIYLSDSQITSSVMGGSGNGGDIEVKAPKYVVMNNGIIMANAHEGKGGNIQIASDHFIKSINSLVSASSELGIDGSIKIQSPNVDLSSGLTHLPEVYLDAGNWVKTPCSLRGVASISRLIISGRDGYSSSILDLQAMNDSREIALNEKFQINKTSHLENYVNFCDEFGVEYCK